METLRGVFPRPKTQPKRDFVKENIRRCKDKSINFGKCSISHENEIVNVHDMASGSTGSRRIKSIDDKNQQKQINKFNKKSTTKENQQKRIESPTELHSNRSRDCSSQTYDIYDDDFLKNVIIRIPSASVLEKLNKKNSPQDDCEINLYGLNSMANSHHDENNKIDEKKQLTSTNSTNTTNATKSPKSIMPTSYKYGELPKYLINMKEKNAEILRLTELEDKNCPDGHVALTEEERIQTLDIANRKFLELIDELNKMPLTTETLRIKKRKIEIEKELNKLEENIQIFSRKKVYVKIDN